MARDDQPLRILILDDSETQLATASEALSEAGYSVTTALTVPEALNLLDDRDSVIVDYHMPAMQGPDAVQVLRGRRHEGVAYYLYTTDTDAATQYRVQGFDGAFTRKGEADALVEQVTSASRLIKMKRFMAARRRDVGD